MPLFEFQCKFDGCFELLLKEAPKGKRACPICGARSSMLVPLTVMQPDTMWAGQNTAQGYFTSKSEYNKLLKEKNLETITSRSELETVRKNVAKAKADKKEKQLNNLSKHLTEELKNVTIDPDGNTLKETRNYVRARNKSTE